MSIHLKPKIGSSMISTGFVLYTSKIQWSFYLCIPSLWSTISCRGSLVCKVGVQGCFEICETEGTHLFYLAIVHHWTLSHVLVKWSLKILHAAWLIQRKKLTVFVFLFGRRFRQFFLCELEFLGRSCCCLHDGDPPFPFARHECLQCHMILSIHWTMIVLWSPAAKYHILQLITIGF